MAKYGPTDVEDTVEVELQIMKTMLTCVSLDLRRREVKRLRECLAQPEWKKGKP